MTLALLALVKLKSFSLVKLLCPLIGNFVVACVILTHVRTQGLCIDKIITYQDGKSHGHMLPDTGLSV